MPRVTASQGQPEPARVTLGGYAAEIWPWLAHVHVPSRTDPGTVYLVVVTPAGVTCPCPGFGYRQTCSHATEVADLIQV